MKNAIRNGAVIASGLLFLLFVYLILIGATEAQFIAVAVLLVFTVLATRLDDIVKVQFGATGVAADLQKKLEEAQATVNQLHAIAELFARLSVDQISGSGRWNSLSPTAKREQIEEIENGLRKIEMPEEQIAGISALQDRWHDFDYYHWVMEGVTHSNDPDITKHREAFKETWPDKGLDTQPPPAAVEKFLTEIGVNKGEITERLADWKMFEATSKHRRLAIFERRQGTGQIIELHDLMDGKTC